jgi:hypothetical protein
MVDSPSEISSEEELSLRENLDWHAAILAVLLEEAGGAVEISAEDLNGISLASAQATVSYDPERDVYTIERVRQE